MLENSDRPTIEESYSTAGNTSNMQVEVERTGDVDIIIAAGMNPSRLGGCLLRLRSEFDGYARLKEATAPDARLLFLRLKSLKTVCDQVTLQALKWDMAGAEALASKVVAWWLDKNCPACHGLKFEVVKNAPSLSSRGCKTCQCSGEQPLPGRESGKRLVNFMDDCVHRACTSIKRRLRPE